MEIAALVLSVIAIIAAGASALYTKRQADAASAVVAIEEARRDDELEDRRRQAQELHRARLSISGSAEGGNAFRPWTLRNSGKARATNARVVVADLTVKPHWMDEVTEVGTLEPDATYRGRIDLSEADMLHPIPVRIAWDDDLGHHEATDTLRIE
ncbi:hypothetical protein [Terrabacter sp. Root181]|uniref:hypothetical protein n=1 Tax=Terrabacter sp. Root181 TaxID=1736484 RepID=UPI0006FB274A|nr:hypothetical protein [Terrabacter sp. Root181]KRB45011.1 hypothetical protein ASD90_15055 [Terrabacter sp. Root181]